MGACWRGRRGWTGLRVNGWTGRLERGGEGVRGRMGDQLVMDGNDRTAVAKRWVMGCNRWIGTRLGRKAAGRGGGGGGGGGGA